MSNQWRIGVLIILGALIATTGWAGSPDYEVVANYTGYPGYYIGGNVGAGMARIDSVTVDTIHFNAQNTTGLAGGVYAGYKFTDFVAVELGFDAYNRYNYNFDLNTFAHSSNTIYRDLCNFDLLGRLSTPTRPFFVTGAGGVAVVLTGYKGLRNTMSRTFTQPMAQLGVGCYVTRAVSIGLAYGRIFGQGNFNPIIQRDNQGRRWLYINKDALPDLDLAAFNVTIDL